MTNTVLKIKNVSKCFGKKKVIDNISFEVNQGEIFGFLGPNGAGKTTTIRMILGLMEFDSGEVKVNGYDVRKEFEKAMENIGAIVENPDLYKHMSGLDNLKLYARIRNISMQRINEVIELVELKDRAKDMVGKYSLGMKQRLGLALILLHKPKVLILDEPTNGLDPAGIKLLRDILKEIAHKEGVAVFVSSHILSEMQQMCDKIAIINDGKIIEFKDMATAESDPVEKVEIKVKNVEDATNIIKEKFQIEPIIEKENIIITIATEKIPNVIKELAKADVEIKAVIPKENSIEEIFFNATNGGTNNEKNI